MKQVLIASHTFVSVSQTKIEDMPLYSIVIPVYNGEKMLNKLYERIAAVFDDTLRLPFEILMVDDGSKDGSFNVMKELRAKDKRVRIYQMARNFGQHPAILCGFQYVRGEYIITMDDDLQHPPEEIPKLIKVMDERDDVDVILARYKNRHHGFIRRLGTRVSVWATSKMLGKDPDLEITSFRLIKRPVVDAIKNTTVHLPQIGNLLVQTTSHIINVDVRHDERAYGKSGYSFSSLAKSLLFDITTHSAFPLIVVRNLGIGVFLFSLILALFFFIRYFVVGTSIEGWTSLAVLVLAFSGIILLSLGIMGDYLLHIMEESKKQSNYVLRIKDDD